MRMRRTVVVGSLVVAVGGGAVIASATTGVNASSAIPSRGTVAQGIVIGKPVTKTATKTVKVRARGRTYSRRVSVKYKSVDPMIACGAKAPCETAFQELKIAPGGHTGWHSHPGPTLVSITQGTGTLYHAGMAADGCHGRVYRVGSGFFQPPAEVHNMRNEGTEPLVLHAVYVLPQGTSNAAIRIDQPQPANCPNVP